MKQYPVFILIIFAAFLAIGQEQQVGKFELIKNVTRPSLLNSGRIDAAKFSPDG